jgi:DNA-binding PadR family transcriptional regulator
MESASEEPSLDALATLGLLAERDTHGWTLVRAMAPQGEIGRVWSVRRAVVYRTIRLMIDAGLVEPAGIEHGARGAPRTLLHLTPAGRRTFERWLAEPVEHVRDLRSALLLKLLFAQRAGLACAPLLRAQQAILAETVEALDTQLNDQDPIDLTLRAFRLWTARAGLLFVEGELARLGDG